MSIQDISLVEILLSILCCLCAALIYLQFSNRGGRNGPVIQERIIEKVVHVPTDSSTSRSSDPETTSSGCDATDHQIPEMKGNEKFEKSMYANTVRDGRTPLDQQTFAAKMQQRIDEGEVASLIQLYGELLEELENLPLRIAVTGRSGVGKSTFINTIRGVTAESKYAADTGVTETTKMVREYQHPEFKQMVLCDLPGAGTKKFPRETYLTDPTIGFKEYDMFIILTSQRIFDDDIWLAQEAKKCDKYFLFVRTQVDSDIDKERKSKPTKFTKNVNAEAQVLTDIRVDLENQLRKDNVYDDNHVFLLDCTDLSWTKYDFEHFNRLVKKDFPALKREAYVKLLTTNIPDQITKVVESNRKWLSIRNVLYALLFAIPFPGIPTLVCMLMRTKTIPFYRDKLGLTDKQLKKAAEPVGKSLSDLKQIGIRCLGFRWRMAGLAKDIGNAIVADGVKWLLLISAGDVGFIVGIFASFVGFLYFSVEIQRGVLDVLAADAMKLEAHFKPSIKAQV